MTCLICKKGQAVKGKTTVTLDREGLTLVVKGVPAKICDNCGEEYLDATITKQLLKEADQALRNGIQVDVRQYDVI